MTNINPSNDYYQIDGKLKIISVSSKFIRENPDHIVSQCIGHFIHSPQCCHFNVKCNGCNKENFMGYRYIPDLDQNIDFCESCFQKKKDNISLKQLNIITYPIDIAPYCNRYILIENIESKNYIALFQYTSYCNIFTLIYRYYYPSVSISSVLERVMDFITRCVEMICPRKDLIDVIDFKVFMYIGKDINIESNYFSKRTENTKITILDMKLDFEAIEYYNYLSFKKIDNKLKIREVKKYYDIEIQTEKQIDPLPISQSSSTNLFAPFVPASTNNIVVSQPVANLTNQGFTFGGTQPFSFNIDKK